MKHFLPSVFFLIVLVLSHASFGQGLLQTKIASVRKEGTVKSYLKDISKRTGIQISYSNTVVNIRRKVTLTKEVTTVGELLSALLAGQPATIVERSDKILIVPIEEKKPATASRVTINGYVKDAASKEVLIGAMVYFPALNIGTQTNSYGFYSLTVPAGNHQLVVGYVGYQQSLIPVTFDEHTRRDIELLSATGMEEIKVSSSKERPDDHVHLTANDVNNYASLLGDNDVMRALQHQPGVQSGSDGSVSLHVRGCDPGQNLNLLDGVPLYYTDHIAGISSIYNTEALKTVDFYKDAFPSRFGGRLSSIIDVNTKDGNMERFGGQANIGLLNGGVSLEGPLVKDKGSVIITARRSWLDLSLRALGENEVGVDFYDINAKANYILNKSNRVYLSIYNGRDQFRVTQDDFEMRSRWGNTFVAGKWTSILGPRLFLHTTATYSYFRYRLRDVVVSSSPDSATTSFPQFEGQSTIIEKSLKTKLFWYLNDHHHIEAGLNYVNGTFNPASILLGGGVQGAINSNVPATEFTVNEQVAYLEDNIKIGSKWQLRLGAHLASWVSTDFNYANLQPRMYLNYKPTNAFSLYGSYTKMAQFLHLVTNSTIGFPTDFWLPSTARLKPETMDMGSVGAKTQLGKDFKIGLELYYKDIQNVVTYRTGKTVFQNASMWEDKLIQGRGWSYGAELFLSKKIGPVASSLAYTLSRSFRQFDNLNRGEAFPYRYDRRHNLKLDASYEWKKGITIVAGFTYMSGEAITLPDQIYPDFDNNLLNGLGGGEFTYNYTRWNNFRLPAVHRLDIAVNFFQKKRKYYERTWTIGLFNVYGRKNYVGTSLIQDDNGTYQLEALSITRFIPTLSYRLKF